jgi:hypothetical protein
MLRSNARIARGKHVAVLVEADGDRPPRAAVGRSCTETIVSGPRRVTVVAQVMLRITTYQLTFVTSNRTFNFRRNRGGFILRFLDSAHSSSYAPPQLTPVILPNQARDLIARRNVQLWLSMLRRRNHLG